MKLSELIIKLSKVLESQGDVEFYIMDNSGVEYEIEGTHLVKSEDNSYELLIEIGELPKLVISNIMR
ncbi:hypothetical protein [Caudoviricetes sp.]|nr:hypothetical protein [Caudoviricetes sp.]